MFIILQTVFIATLKWGLAIMVYYHGMIKVLLDGKYCGK